MTVNVGVIGLGVMGAEHARIAAHRTPGARLAGVFDVDAARAEAIARETGAFVAERDPLSLIDDPRVDAVFVVSPDDTHKQLVLACLRAGKPVLCEKPLAPTTGDCLEIVKAELAVGRRLLQVGYNRRFDPWYLDLKAQLQSGRFGTALMLHCQHRNVVAPSWFTSAMAISNSAVHDFDIARWLLDDEFTSVQALEPTCPGDAVPGSPVFMVLETALGKVVDIEVFNNARYGYEVNAELVCENGAISLGSNSYSHVKRDLAQGTGYPEDWRPRFADSYREQMAAWVRSVTSGVPCGASAWDGYMAALLASTALGGLRTRGRQEVPRQLLPDLYA